MYWLGNEVLSRLTVNGRNKLRFDISRHVMVPGTTPSTVRLPNSVRGNQLHVVIRAFIHHEVIVRVLG